jgi:hypothetical protein
LEPLSTKLRLSPEALEQSGLAGGISWRWRVAPD